MPENLDAMQALRCNFNLQQIPRIMDMIQGLTTNFTGRYLIVTKHY